MRPLDVAQAVAAVAVGVRLARGRRRLPPLAPVPRSWARPFVSVVVPARNEEGRIGPCLSAILADRAAGEVIVVDDQSSDGTAKLAAEMGARVVAGQPPPDGWVGKQWALHQGVEAASGEIIVTLDADTRPKPGLLEALVTALCHPDGEGQPEGERHDPGRHGSGHENAGYESVGHESVGHESAGHKGTGRGGSRRYDLVSAGPRFICGGPLEQALHASFLATLVYRFGPIGPATPPAAHRVVANGQCMAFRREAMRAAGGFARIRGHMTDDVALARTLAASGWAVGFLDAGGLLEVDMHDSVTGVWREWGRSLPLRDVTGPAWQAADLAVVWLTAALPVLRLVAGRPTRLDLGLITLRTLLGSALRGSYTRPGIGVLLSPLLDPVTAVRLTQATLRPVRTWRSRTYPHVSGHSEIMSGRPQAVSGARPAPPARNAAR
ncbi:glycosyltransferase family 2 protein [Planotetraspora sp. GP83]|uniref:glycosyltransferase n=1 Tax=Planotetraspora sp. GP83 TaxID=3156264 RepID=UPI0035193AC2